MLSESWSYSQTDSEIHGLPVKMWHDYYEAFPRTQPESGLLAERVYRAFDVPRDCIEPLGGAM